MKNQLVILVSTFFVTFADNSAVQDFTNANNLFARNVYKEIATGNDGNFLVSPFSAETVLAFLQSGTKGKSGDEIRTALHLPNDKNKVEVALKSLLPKIKGNNLYSLHTANKIYIKENFETKTEFKNAASDVYHAESESIDFSKNVEAAKTVNNWVEKQTNHKIKDLVDPADFDKYTFAVLVNALYFKANWSNPFLLSGTKKQTFHKTTSDTVEVDTLHHYQEYFNYYECPHLEAQFLELTFQGGEATLTVVLPKDKNGLANLENQLNQVFTPQHHLEETYLNVALPKFRIETTIDFKTVLQKLGVKTVFGTDADLSGIAGDPGDLYVKKVTQKTFIDLSEGGVEAAAATVIVTPIVVTALVENLNVPKNFTADHPFIFYIKVNDVIIFAGRVTDPSRS